MRVEVTKSGLKWIYTIYKNNKQVFNGGFYSSRILAIEASYITIKRIFNPFPKIINETSNTYNVIGGE